MQYTATAAIGETVLANHTSVLAMTEWIADQPESFLADAPRPSVYLSSPHHAPL